MPNMPQDDPKMAPMRPNMVRDTCLELFWAFVLGCLGAPWLYPGFAFALPSRCLRCAVASLLLCPCFAFALPLCCFCFVSALPFLSEWGDT